jgi:hypothetical protein
MCTYVYTSLALTMSKLRICKTHQISSCLLLADYLNTLHDLAGKESHNVYIHTYTCTCRYVCIYSVMFGKDTRSRHIHIYMHRTCRYILSQKRLEAYASAEEQVLHIHFEAPQHVCKHTQIHCIYTHIDAHAHTSSGLAHGFMVLKNIQAHACTYIHTYIHTLTYTTLIHTCIHKHTTYIHTHQHTCIHACMHA